MALCERTQYYLWSPDQVSTQIITATPLTHPAVLTGTTGFHWLPQASILYFDLLWAVTSLLFSLINSSAEGFWKDAISRKCWKQASKDMADDLFLFLFFRWKKIKTGCKINRKKQPPVPKKKPETKKYTNVALNMEFLESFPNCCH